jgi:alpha-1,2-mannosyltransferase
VLLSALPLIQHRQGRPFPGPTAAAIVVDLPACVAIDYPMTLIQMDMLRRNLERGCRFEVDLGGASYHLEAGEYEDMPRDRNEVWQAYALEYLRTGDAVVLARFSSGVGFSPETRRWCVGGLSSAGLGATLFAFPSRNGRRGVSHGGL